MKAMILAAGLGSRMRPLTDNCPKPLLKANGKALIDYHLERLSTWGISEVVINTHWLSGQVQEHISSKWSTKLKVHVLEEPDLLETAGGIVNALTVLDSPSDEPFLVINGDIFFDADLKAWLNDTTKTKCAALAHLLLCANPSHNETGDFSLTSEPENSHPIVTLSSPNTHTYSGIGLYRPSMFRDLPKGKRALGPILKQLVNEQEIHASELDGYWLDVGTPARLNELEKHLKNL